MKKDKLFGLLAVLIMFFSVWCGLGVKPAQAVSDIQFYESQITSNNADQVSPDIYEYGLNDYAIVWQDNRNGNWDIYMFYEKYLGNGQWDVQWDVRITANSGNNMLPKIYNDTIVYQSDRNGNWDIYAYNITSKVETQITNNTAKQELPDIYGNIIVWQDHRDERWDGVHWYVAGYDVYMYNLTAKTESRLPLPEQNAYNPAISGNTVVYTGENYQQFLPSGDTIAYPYVCTYDVSTGVKTNIAAGAQTWQSGVGIVPPDLPHMGSPAIDGNLVAWKNNDARVIGVKDVSTGSTWQSWNGREQNPEVSRNWIVFENYMGGPWTLYVYNFVYGDLSNATDTKSRSQNPALSSKYSDFLVYQNDRSGHWHIYLTSFWSGTGAGNLPPEPVTPSTIINHIQQVEADFSDESKFPTSIFVGANNQVKENRRNTIINQLDSASASIQDAANTQNLQVRKADLQNAIGQLNELLGKTDGYTVRGTPDLNGSRYTPDWITDFTAQLYLYQTTSQSIAELQTLLKGIS